MISEIHEDMRADRQECPSWLTPTPQYLGSSKAGKLTADQWRTVSLRLTVTLVRKWGNEPSESRYFKMLSNFMHLLSAIKLATMKVINSIIIQQYTDFMKQYLDGVLALYCNVHLTPNQHLALHFGDHLERFGPTYASRAFVIERQNLILQRINTNTKPGMLDTHIIGIAII